MTDPVKRVIKRNPELIIKRHTNISHIRELHDPKFTYKVIEKRILMYPLPNGSNIFIRYPGKESILTGDYLRPWDFRPVIISKAGISGKDLQFLDFWTSISSIFKIEDKEHWIKFCSILYNLAYMNNHKKEDKITRDIEFVKTETDKEIVIKKDEITLTNIYIYHPPVTDIKEIETKINTICDLSILEFLYYLELLCWNEDCKYFFEAHMDFVNSKDKRDTELLKENKLREELNEKAGTYKAKKKRLLKPKEKPNWIGSTGRINTILTIINYIGLELGIVKNLKVFKKAAITGVLPIDNEDLKKILPDIS